MSLTTAQRERMNEYFKIRKTIFEMLRDRGYAVSDAELSETLQEFSNQCSYGNVNVDSLTIFQSKIDDRSDKILVFFSEAAKPGIEVFKGYLEKMKQAEANRGIVVVPLDLSPYSRKALDYLSKTNKTYAIEYFFERELLVNITKHQLVPKHQVLTEEEKTTLLQKYHLKGSQLPRILATDPISRYYGLRTGQVVKITRPSETAGRYVTYRIVL